LTRRLVPLDQPKALTIGIFALNQIPSHHLIEDIEPHDPPFDSGFLSTV
jgi:hypothetical protein